MNRMQRMEHIAKTLGPYRAARYAVRRGISIEAALWVICKRGW